MKKTNTKNIQIFDISDDNVVREPRLHLRIGRVARDLFSFEFNFAFNSEPMKEYMSAQCIPEVPDIEATQRLEMYIQCQCDFLWIFCRNP